MKITPPKDQNFLQKIFFWFSKLLIKSSSQDKAISLLIKNIHLFQELDPDQRSFLAKSFIPVRYKAGEKIINQGDIGDKFYLIKEGSVRIFVTDVQQNTEIVLARLEAGDYFGEQALLEVMPGKRNASAKAVVDTTLFALPHSEYVKILNPKLKSLLQDLGKKEIVEMLNSKLETFNIIKPDILKQFSGKTLNYSDGDIIFKIGDDSDRVYFIISGQVEIKLPEEKNERTTVLGSGELFGELGVLQQAKRAGTAIAKGELTVLSFDQDEFKKIYASSSELQKHVKTLKSVYQIQHRGMVNLYHGNFLGMKAIFTVYNLENERTVTSAKVIDMPVFSMAYSDVKEDLAPLHYGQGAEIRRKLTVSNNKILSVTSFGEWDELGEICDLILRSQSLTDAQIELFKSTGSLGFKKLKIISVEERKETLCYCMNVSRGQIYDAISNGVNQVGEMTKQTGAGSVCGTCRPKIVELLGLRPWSTIKLIQKVPLAKNIASFRFQSVDSSSSDYLPGQHIVIQALINNQLINRVYTITSISNINNYIELTVKREERGCFSNWLFDQAHESSLIRMAEPQGNFTLGKQEEIPIVFFVGGIGVTPAMAFARYIALKQLKYRLHVEYSAKTQLDLIWLDEWKELTSNNKNITIQFRKTAEEGRLERVHVEKVIEEFPKADFYICGPKSYEQFISSVLIEKIPQSKIKKEEFVHAGGPI